jgi:radical SAM protein with 4Fe4S-binding SPASM domain
VDYSQDRGLADALATLNSDTFQVIYRAESMQQEREQHHYDKCNATPFFWVYAMANGDVFTCSAHLMDQRFNIGNLNRQTFREIWEGDRRRENWEMMRDTFSIKQCRKNCRMDKSNRYLAEFGAQQHVNFI